MHRCDVPRDFDGPMTWLRAHPESEGVVGHHPDGRMAKLKHRDAVARPERGISPTFARPSG